MMRSTVPYLTDSSDDLLVDLERIKRFTLPLAKRHDGPFYIYDEKGALESYRRFTEAFRATDREFETYYALKSNSFPGLLKTLRKAGCNFDVSSVREFDLARKAGARRFVFTGPGKTEKDLLKILGTKGVEACVHIESPRELQRLEQVAKTLGRTLPFAIRVVPESYAAWSKFGVSLGTAQTMLSRYSSRLRWAGVHIHMSYAKTAQPYMRAVEQVGAWLRQLPAAVRSTLEFIDLGGGFYPETIEGDYAWNKDGVLLFDRPGLQKSILRRSPARRAKRIAVESIESVAAKIDRALRRHVDPVVPDTQLWLEPGRYLSHRCMHIVLRVVDQKTPDAVILNGGWNMVGWEKYQYVTYAPVYNLSAWDPTTEQACCLFGNLCIPEDIWGYYVHGRRCSVGDVLVIPYQGAYTYTYRQEFIRGIPPVIEVR